MPGSERLSGLSAVFPLVLRGNWRDGYVLGNRVCSDGDRDWSAGVRSALVLVNLAGDGANNLHGRSDCGGVGLAGALESGWDVGHNGNGLHR